MLLLIMMTMIVHSHALLMQNTGTTAVEAFGTVQGRVIDEHGEPLPGAKVYADPVEVKDVRIGKMRFFITKDDGTFTLEQVVPGLNLICASKEEALFPDTGAAAFAVNLEMLPRVRVEQGKLTAGVTVQLTKGGKLSGSISDSLSGQPVTDSRIHLSRIDDPRLFVSTGPDETGHFEFVVPSKPFRLQVTASGYRTHEHVGEILVERASTKEITVRLQRSGSPTAN
jgi:hypothetical protein